MKNIKVGIIAEYNPFHNGHIHHLNCIKKMFKDASITVVMSTSFTQRGIPSIINKWDKTKIALDNGIDLVIELPFPYQVQSADIFARASIEILKNIGCDYLVFGSEENDIEKLIKLANVQLNNKDYDEITKKYLSNGENYPTALNKALEELTKTSVNTPNDLLALSYVKEIIKQDAKITPISIPRTNSYHSVKLTKDIASATSIRKALERNEDIKGVVPNDVALVLNKNYISLNDYFNLLKYKIYSSHDLSIYLGVDEGIENRIMKIIDDVNNIDELIMGIKTKRYTYNKITRMLIHILCGCTKEENKKYEHVPYIRVLGFSKKGQNILKEAKKISNLPIITKYKKGIPLLELEKRITSIYASVLDKNEAKKLIEDEYKKRPIERTELNV